MTQRLFVALNLDPPTKLALGRLLTQLPNQSGVAKTKIDNLHLTLQFLGEIDEELIPQIQTILNTAVIHYQPLVLSFTQLGAFPNWVQPHSIWIGISCPSLMKLQDELAQQLIKLVPTMDTKPFQPHLTLARIKSPLSSAELSSIQTIPIASLTNQINHIDLMASELTPRGSIYTCLSQHQLTT